jgi:hypothetical protein
MTVREAFCYSNLPTGTARWPSGVLPLPGYRWLQDRLSYGLALVAFGQ